MAARHPSALDTRESSARPAHARESGVREAARAPSTVCVHCGGPLPPGASVFCCAGCALVSSLLTTEGLTRYYALRGPEGVAPTAAAAARTEIEHAWLAPFEAKLAAAAPNEPVRIALDVQGIHCAACVWLIDELFRREPGALSIVVNPTLGKIDLVADATFALRAWVDHVERFGYALGPSRKARASASSSVLARMGVCVAIAMNAMIFAFARYFGLAEGPIARLFATIELGLAFASVAVGGSLFFASAWKALRARVLHLDVPIALGLLLALAGSTWSFVATAAAASYFDTVCVFVALMLVGRFLQERVVEKNRRALLESDGVDGLVTRRVEAGGVHLVPCRAVRAKDLLLVAPGDIVCVDATLEDEMADVSLDWINGESAPRRLARGSLVPAGAFNVGRAAVRARATTAFAESPLVDLLRTTTKRDADVARATPWWQRFARVYVLAVLAAAAGAFAIWAPVAGVPRALEVATAVLVVTCPCAFGIATPMAYELVQSGLRRAGLFVRSPGFLDRAQKVRRVVFDKTGTLTSTAVAASDTAAILELDDHERQALYNLVARSSHPKSAAIRHALETACGLHAVAFDAALDVVEHPGSGLSLQTAEHAYALDRRGFVVDGVVRAALDVEEELRHDARAEVQALREAGYDVWVLSGDEQTRVNDMADRLGVPRAHAVGSATPARKADFIAAHDAGDTLMIGDGINDGLAVERATCSGTPAIDRPFMPARSDFYFTTPGLRPVGLALRASRALGRVTRRNLIVAVAYNVVSVALAYAGLMSPLLCAVVMPVSSLSVVALTTVSLSPRSALWKS